MNKSLGTFSLKNGRVSLESDVRKKILFQSFLKTRTGFSAGASAVARTFSDGGGRGRGGFSQ